MNKSNDLLQKNNFTKKRYEVTISVIGQQEPKKKNVYLRNTKFDNYLFINNLEREFEIRRLKKKIYALKNNKKMIMQNLDNIKKRNYILKNEILKNKKKELLLQ